MKKVYVLIAAMMVMIGVQAQSGLPEKLENIKSKIDPASIAGINFYDSDVILKTLKIKKASKKLEISNLVNSYNTELNDLRLNNTALLGKFGSNLIGMMKAKEYNQIWNARSDYKNSIESIRNESAKELIAFETSLLESTNKRQQRKYYKYKRAMLEDQKFSIEVGDIFSMIGM